MDQNIIFGVIGSVFACCAGVWSVFTYCSRAFKTTTAEQIGAIDRRHSEKHDALRAEIALQLAEVKRDIGRLESDGKSGLEMLIKRLDNIATLQSTLQEANRELTGRHTDLVTTNTIHHGRVSDKLTDFEGRLRSAETDIKKIIVEAAGNK